MAVEMNNRKVTWAWTMYDWANSVFSLTIATAIFPPYYEAVTKAAAIEQGSPAEGPFSIRFFGLNLDPSALYSYSVALGFLLVVICSPILSGIADSRGNKKSFMKFFCYLGGLCCIGLYFFDKNHIWLGVALFVMSMLGFGGSIVFYNAYLPEIATEDQLDRLSARGFSMGYLGSVLLLIMNLVTIMMPDTFFPVQSYANELMSQGQTQEAALKAATGHYEGVASILSFVSVGIWWIGFAQIPFHYLPNGKPSQANSEGGIISKGWRELSKVYKEIQTQNSHSHIKRYLWGFFFLSCGVQTVMYVATLFGSRELHLPTAVLIVTVLIIQLIGILGASLFARVSSLIGNIRTILIMVLIWIGVCATAYFIQTEVQFYILGALVGLVMGGIQSLFRSTYAKLIPASTKDTASYFSFYDVTEKLAIVLGTISYGLIIDLTGSMRNSALALTVFFLIGLSFMVRMKNFKSHIAS